MASLLKLHKPPITRAQFEELSDFEQKKMILNFFYEVPRLFRSNALEEISELIEQNNVIINSQNKSGETILFLVIYYIGRSTSDNKIRDFEPILDVLFKNGVDISIRNNSGETIIDYLNKHIEWINMQEIKDLLMSKSKPTDMKGTKPPITRAQFEAEVVSEAIPSQEHPLKYQGIYISQSGVELPFSIQPISSDEKMAYLVSLDGSASSSGIARANLRSPRSGSLFYISAYEFEDFKTNVVNKDVKWRVHNKDDEIVSIPGYWTMKKTMTSYKKYLKYKNKYILLKKYNI